MDYPLGVSGHNKIMGVLITKTELVEEIKRIVSK